MPRKDGLLGRAAERVGELIEAQTGQVLVEAERVHELVEAEQNLRYTWRELEDLGWKVMDYFNAQPGEVSPESRRKMVQKCRVLWENDPQAFAAVALMNDFCFGRGIPTPQCKDELVQEKVEEAWNDPDNQRVLTSYRAQVMRGTDLGIQANVFILLFDDSADGKVKLGLLQHDTVDAAIRDPENNLRVVHYLTRQRKQKWDYKQHQPVLDDATAQAKIVYYEAWGGLEEAEEERSNAPDGADMVPLERPKPEQTGRGLVFHVAINLHGEKVFGTPDMQRSIRWLTAYNDFMKARIDVMKAVAAFTYQRRFKGGPEQLRKQAAQLISRDSPLATQYGSEVQAGPRPASIIDLNQAAQWEPMKMDTGAAGAQADARAIGGQVSAVHRFPRGYFGDADASNLAGATSLELPVLKAVESRQEVWESLYRWFIDRVIEKAVDDGAIPEELEPEELAAALQKRGWQWFELAEGQRELRPIEEVTDPDGTRYLVPGDRVWRPGESKVLVEGFLHEGHEDSVIDEESTQRDLGYEFKMPSPLRRMMPELVGAIMNIARTFDPNNENVELSRILLMVALSEALEMQDAADLVDKVFPEGYQPSGAEGAPGVPPEGAEDVTAMFQPSAAGQQLPAGADGNAYGAPVQARTPEAAARAGYGQGALAASSFEVGADGRPRLRLVEGEPLVSGSHEDGDPVIHAKVTGSTEELDAAFEQDVRAVAIDELDRATATVED